MTAIARPDGLWEIADVTGKTALQAGAPSSKAPPTQAWGRTSVRP